MTKQALILGIESTCDETGIAVVRGEELLTDVTATSVELHERFGGIIPEIASRAHLESFLPTLDAALEKADVRLEDIDALAVAAGPGLVGSLTVGITAAKGLALALNKPLYGVNHVIGHLAVDIFDSGPLPERFIGLVASGGHSSLLLVEGITESITELGSTLDDAAGEAFDKIGRLLGLPYPGGPHLDRLASTGDRTAVRFPRGLAAGKDKHRYRYDFSFSGLKTAVTRYVEQNPHTPHADVAAGFSESVNDSLTKKTVAAAKDHDVETIVVGGGFAANSRLRELLDERASAAGVSVRIPPVRLCTDNGAQIGALGALLYAADKPPSPNDFGPRSNMGLETIYLTKKQHSV